MSSRSPVRTPTKMEAEQGISCDKARASAAVMAWRRLYDRGRDNNDNKNDNNKSTIRSTHVTGIEHCMSGMASNNNKIEMKINIVTSGGSTVNTDGNNNDYNIAIAKTTLQSRGRAVHNDNVEVVDFTAAANQGTNGYSSGTTVIDVVAIIKNNSSILCRGESFDVVGGEQQRLANTYVVLSNGEANQLQHQQVKPYGMNINNREDYDHDIQGVNNNRNGYEGSTDFVVAIVAELEINDSKRLVGDSILDWLIGTGVLILREYTLRSTSHDGILSCPRNNTSLNHRSATGSDYPDYPVGTKDLSLDLCLDRRSVVLDPTLLNHRSVMVEGQDSRRTERIKTSLKNLEDHRSVIVEGRDISGTERIKTSFKNREKMIGSMNDTQSVGVAATYIVTTMSAGCSKTAPKSQEKMMGRVDNAQSVGATYIVTATMSVGYGNTNIDGREEGATAEEVATYVVTTDTDVTGSYDQQDMNRQRKETPVDVERATYIVTADTDAGCTGIKIDDQQDDDQQETREEIEEEIDVEGAAYIVTADTDIEENSEKDTEETVDSDVDEAAHIVTSDTDIDEEKEDSKEDGKETVDVEGAAYIVTSDTDICLEKKIEERKDVPTGVGATYIVTADTDVKHVESRQEEIELEDDLPGNEGVTYVVTAGNVWNVNKNNDRYGSGSKFSLRILQSRVSFVNMGWTFMLELILEIALKFELTLNVLWQMAGVWFSRTWIYVSPQSRFGIDATDYSVGTKDLYLCIDRRSVLRKVQSGDSNGHGDLRTRNDEVAGNNNGWPRCTNYGLIITS